jgi:tetratricopeptide (TPR) repeat protein
LAVEIDDFVDRCLQKDPARRPTGWDEVVEFWTAICTRFGVEVPLDETALVQSADKIAAQAYSFLNLNEPTKALEAAARAIALDSSCAHAWEVQGQALTSLKRHDEGLQSLERALALDPGNPEAWRRKALCLLELKLFHAAHEAIDRAISLWPDDSLMRGTKAAVYCGAGEFNQALHEFERALQLPDIPHEVRVSYALLLMKLSRRTEALAEFEAILARAPNYLFGWLCKGDLLYELQRPAAAIPAYERAINIDPASVRA